MTGAERAEAREAGWMEGIRDALAACEAQIPINPLYKLGAERVGCWPCIKASKSEIRLVSELDPGRIEQIRRIEEDTGNKMFCLERSRAGGVARLMEPKSIDEVVAWSKTKRGGMRLAVVAEPSGCARWGLCEPPRPDDEEGDDT